MSFTYINFSVGNHWNLTLFSPAQAKQVSSFDLEYSLLFFQSIKCTYCLPEDVNVYIQVVGWFNREKLLYESQFVNLFKEFISLENEMLLQNNNEHLYRFMLFEAYLSSQELPLFIRIYPESL